MFLILHKYYGETGDFLYFFFEEHLWVTASDILMQVCYGMLQCSLNFCFDLVFGRAFFSHALQERF